MRNARHLRFVRAIAVALSMALLCACGGDDDSDGSAQWIGAWTMAPLEADPPISVQGATLRQVVRVTASGERIRIRLSNLFGSDPLDIEAASIAYSTGDSAIALDSLRTLSFDGATAFSIAPGAEVVTDPVELSFAALTDVAISLYFASANALATTHVITLTSSFVADGDRTSTASLGEELPGFSRVGSWYVVTGVEVERPVEPTVIVAIGDSITDGFGAAETNGSWPERLADELRGRASVLNTGISGNRIFRAGLPSFGPRILDRFDRDVLEQPGVTTVVIQAGINDLQAPALPGVFGDDPPSPPVTSDDLIAGVREIINRAKEKDLTVVGGTLLPYPALASLIDGGEISRSEFNRWIRESGELDAVIDFDAALRDPDMPTRMLSAYDSGDTLHPNDAGYQAMADAAFAVLFPTVDRR